MGLLTMNLTIQHGIKAHLLKCSLDPCMDRVVAYERELSKGFSGCDAQESSRIEEIQTYERL